MKLSNLNRAHQAHDDGFVLGCQYVLRGVKAVLHRDGAEAVGQQLLEWLRDPTNDPRPRATAEPDGRLAAIARIQACRDKAERLRASVDRAITELDAQ